MGAGLGAGRDTVRGAGFGVGRLMVRGAGLGAGFGAARDALTRARTESKYCCFDVVGRDVVGREVVGREVVGRGVGFGVTGLATEGLVLRMIFGELEIPRLVEGFGEGLGSVFDEGVTIRLGIEDFVVFRDAVGFGAGVDGRELADARAARAASTRALTVSRYFCFDVVGSDLDDGWVLIDGREVVGLATDGLTADGFEVVGLEAVVDGFGVLRDTAGFGVTVEGRDVVAARAARAASTRALTESRYCCLVVVGKVRAVDDVVVDGLAVGGFVPVGLPLVFAISGLPIAGRVAGDAGLVLRMMLGEPAALLVRSAVLALRAASTRAFTESRYSCLRIVGREFVGPATLFSVGRAAVAGFPSPRSPFPRRPLMRSCNAAPVMAPPIGPRIVDRFP